MMPLVTAENTPLPRGTPRPVAALPEGADFAAVLGRLRAMMASEQPVPGVGPVVEAPPEGEEVPEAAAPEPEVAGTPDMTVISPDSAFGAFLALPEGTADPADPADQASTPGVPGRESLLRARLVLDRPGVAPFVAEALPGTVQSDAAVSHGAAAEAPAPDQPLVGNPTPDTRPADPPLTPRPLWAQAAPVAQATPQPPALTDPLAPVGQGSAPEAGSQPAQARAPAGQSTPEPPPPLLRPEGQAEPSRLGSGVAPDAQGIAAQHQRSDQARPPQARSDQRGTAQPAPHLTQAPLAGSVPTRLDQAQSGQAGPNGAQPDQSGPHLPDAAPPSQASLTGRIEPRLPQVQPRQTERHHAQPDQTAPDRTQTRQVPPPPSPTGQIPSDALEAAAPMRAPPLAPTQAQTPVADAAGQSATKPVMSPSASPGPVPQPETPPQTGTSVPGALPVRKRRETPPVPMTAAAVPALPPGNQPSAPRTEALPRATPPTPPVSAPAAPGLPAQDPPALRPVAPQPVPATDPAPRPQASASPPAAAPMVPGAPIVARQPDPAPLAPPPEAAAPVPPPRSSSLPAQDPYGPARAVFAASELPRAPATAAAFWPVAPHRGAAMPVARPVTGATGPDPKAVPPGPALSPPGGGLAPPPGTADPGPSRDPVVEVVQRLDAPHRAEASAEPRPGASPPLDMPHRIAQQIAARLETPGHGSFDLALKPEELGHVRLKLVSHETGSLLIVHAERPETLDLMRRHIGALEQDLRALGHDQLSLRFSGGNAGGAGQQATPHAPPSQTTTQGAPPADPRPQTQPAPAPPLRARDHLDLRL